MSRLSTITKASGRASRDAADLSGASLNGLARGWPVDHDFEKRPNRFHPLTRPPPQGIRDTRKVHLGDDLSLVHGAIRILLGKSPMDKIDETERRKGELEALLFASSRPLSTRVLARSLDLSEEHTLHLLAGVASDLAQPGRGLHLREIAGTWRLETKPIHANLVASIRRGKGERPLTQQALETLAVVALRQPVTADEVAAIRGVDSAGTIDTLSKRKLIAKTTPRTAEGTAARWRTTQGFLDLFGLVAMEDLYRDNKLARIFGPVFGYGLGADGAGANSEDSRSNYEQNDSQSQ